MRSTINRWCTAVDWVELQFQAIAPVFLVHGLGGSAGTWTSSYTQPLAAASIPYDTVELAGYGWTGWNSFRLTRKLQELADQYGAKKCHIVAHSKGGLDVRSYLNGGYDPERLKVLSVYTLGTPHHGTRAADVGLILTGVLSHLTGAWRLFLAGNSIFGAFVDLTTVQVGLFNYFNPGIPEGTAFYSFAGDADIDRNRSISPIENSELEEQLPTPIADLSYKIVGYGERAVIDVAPPSEWGDRILNGADIVVFSQFAHNDILVSNLSARWGEVQCVRTANHATLKKATAATVIDGIKRGGPVNPCRSLTAAEPAGVSTNAVVRDLFRLTPEERTRTYNVTIDNSPSATFFLLAASRTLNVAVTAPGGTRHTAQLVPLANDGVIGGAYLIDLTNPVPGTWSVSVTEPGPLTSLNVVATVLLQNGVQSLLVGADEPVPLGTKIRHALVVFDGTHRLTGLTVAALLLRPDDAAFAPVPVTFRDDGTDADTRAGDGIYQAFVTPPAPGDYAVRVEALGTASTGSFRRSSLSELRVVRRQAEITNFDDFGVDDNFDGLDDRIVIQPEAILETAGSYEVFVRLRAANGRELQRSVEETFTAGRAGAEVPFGAREIIDGLKVDGPYTVAEVRFSRVVGEELVPADVQYDLGSTFAYDLDDLQHRRLRLTGSGTAKGIDTGGSAGRYEFLEVQLGVFTEVAGSYSWSVTLRDTGGREISFISGRSQLGAGANTLQFRFPGQDISRKRIDGAYVVTNLGIYGSGQSLIANDVLTTQAFRASQFGDPPRRRRLRH